MLNFKSQFVEMFERGQYPKDEFINIAKEIYAGGDKPKDISKVQDDEYLYPVFANGYENEGLQGYSKSYRTGDNAVTISARGTIGYSFIRNEKFTPIVRLITIIPTEICKRVPSGSACKRSCAETAYAELLYRTSVRFSRIPKVSNGSITDCPVKEKQALFQHTEEYNAPEGDNRHGYL